MSVKSERRAWYAANVEAKPAGEVVGSPAYMEWVARANAHMRKHCEVGTATIKESSEIATVTPIAPKRRKASATELQDRATYDALVDAQRYAIADHMGWTGDYWDDFFKPQKFGADAKRRPDLEFCKGSLKVAWPHLTEEMQRAYEAGVFRWVTYSDFKTEQIAERAAMAEAYEAEAAAELHDAKPCTLCLHAGCVCEPIDWAA